jgi:hypothetical protein
VDGCLSFGDGREKGVVDGAVVPANWALEPVFAEVSLGQGQKILERIFFGLGLLHRLIGEVHAAVPRLHKEPVKKPKFKEKMNAI